MDLFDTSVAEKYLDETYSPTSESRKPEDNWGKENEVFARHLKEQEEIEKIADLVEQLMKSVNTMGKEKIVRAGVIQGLSRSHRYLQAEFFFNFICAALTFWAWCFEKKRFDERNSVAVSVAAKMHKVFRSSC